jgi:uroporphyrinogen-III synthase
VHNDSIANMLDEAGIAHTEAVMYRTVSNDFKEGEPFDYDMLIFFSPSGIQSLLKNFPKFKQNNIVIATYGPTTAQSVIDAGLRLDLQAPNDEHPSMSSALNSYLLQVNDD